jgi:hypothetical protein
MIHSELVEIRKIRHRISEKYDHDLNQLLEYYKALEAKLKASGKYKFVSRSQRLRSMPLKGQAQGIAPTEPSI